MYAMTGFCTISVYLCVSATDPGTDTVSTVDLGNGARQKKFLKELRQSAASGSTKLNVTLKER